MKKLFLQSGKLMIGEFPEEPIKGEFELPYAKAMKKYYAVLESAKASAVEVVNGEDCFHKINDWLTPLPGGGLGRQLQKGELCDLPSGWTVEIGKCDKWCGGAGCVPFLPNKEKCSGPPSKFAKGRLIPSENAQGESGIVATGIPEAEQPEALAFLNEDDWTVPESGAPTYAARLACTRWLSQCLEFGWRKDQLDGLEKIWWQHHDRNGVLVKPDKAVSPPSQVEINTTAPVESEEELWDEMVGRCMEFTSFNYALAQKLYVITRKTVEP